MRRLLRLSYDRKKTLVINAISTIVLALFIIIPNYSKITNINNSDLHFGIFTAMTAFSGFLFTGLSIMISTSDKWFYKELNKANRIDKIYFSIYVGLIFGALSMAISLFFSFNIIQNKHIIVLEFLLSFLTILNFIISLLYLIKVINIMNQYSK